MEKFKYGGNELHVFGSAKNWKAYWSREIRTFLGESVLEIGAGIGSTAKTFAHREYKRWVCLEPDEELCSVIQQEIGRGSLPEKVEVRKGTSASLNQGEMFDTILYIDVLEHIEDDKEELKRIERHLTQSGKIIIVSPAHNLLFSEFDSRIGHFRRYNKKRLRVVIPDGLKIKKLCYIDSVGLIASLVNRLLLRSDSPTYRQIQVWDRFMVTASRLLDILTGYYVGKSIVCVLEKQSE
jgi:SAM-dependent methyltransferase